MLLSLAGGLEGQKTLPYIAFLAPSGCCMGKRIAVRFHRERERERERERITLPSGK